MPDPIKIFTFLFIMLGPLKMIGPFAGMTHGAEKKLVLQVIIRAIFFSCAALLLAALIGETMLKKYGIPLPVLALTGGIILFLVALQGILRQFSPHEQKEKSSLAISMAITPLAFPMIVTPYGIAAVIIFLSLATEVSEKINIGLMLIGIMALNFVMMVFANKILSYLGTLLMIFGAVLSIIQAALGLQIIHNALQQLYQAS